MSPRAPEPGEEILTRKDEMWWRQCPSSADCWDDVNEQPSSLMFRWDPDSGQLSGARQDTTTARKSYEHHVNVEKLGSKGTWALEVGTVTDMSLQLIDDTANLPEPPKSPPGHTYLDARDVSTATSRTGKVERERLRSKLLRAALRPGREYPVAPAAPPASPNVSTDGTELAPPGSEGAG